MTMSKPELGDADAAGDAEDTIEEPEDQLPDYIAPETRRRVLERDNWRCRCCGEEDLGKLTLHHVVYRSHLGGHDEDNLVTLCWADHRLLHDGKLKVARVNGHWFFGHSRNWMRRFSR